MSDHLMFFQKVAGYGNSESRPGGLKIGTLDQFFVGANAFVSWAENTHAIGLGRVLKATGKIAAGDVPTQACQMCFEVWCTLTCTPRTVTLQRMSAEAVCRAFLDSAPATRIQSQPFSVGFVVSGSPPLHAGLRPDLRVLTAPWSLLTQPQFLPFRFFSVLCSQKIVQNRDADGTRRMPLPSTT